MEGLLLLLAIFALSAAARRWWAVIAAAALGIALAAWSIRSVTDDDYLGDSTPGFMALIGGIWTVGLAAVAAAGVLFGKGLSARSRSRATPG